MFNLIFIFACFALTSSLRSDVIHPQNQTSLSSKPYCELPPYPAHGTYTVLDLPTAKPGQVVPGTALNISCDPGFEAPRLNDTIVCYSGIWSRKIPDCEIKVDKCVLPPYPAHGSYDVGGMTRTVPGQEFPTVALTIICNPGYGIEGEKQRICFNGIWSGSIPDCKETIGACILPPFPENGSYAVVGAPDAVPGQAFDNVALIISCNFGHAIPGRKDRTCYMGIWSEEIFDCAPTSELCVLPPFPDHGRYVVWTLPNYYFTPGQVYDFVLVETVCDEEYESLHHRYTGCRDGSWLYDMECVHKPPKISDPDFDHKQDVPIKYLRAYNVSISQSACILPPQPGNGSYSVIGVPNAALGQAFDNVALMISCNTGFGISGRKDRTCFNGIWLANITNCVPISDLEAITPATRNFVTLGNTDLQSQFGMSDSCYLGENPTVNYRCQLSPTSKETRECNLHEPVGTIVRPECKENFFYPGVLNPMRCFASGWNFVPSCIPECGYITPTFELLVEDTAVGGTFAKSGEVPWHAGIYDKKQNYEQICGGTIIRPTVVVSAGHCFVDRMAVAQPASRYAVAVGKLMRSWYDSDDYEAQMFNVTEVIIPKGFQGSIAHFQEDIALVFLDQPIMFTTLIQPVCLDFSPEIEKEQLQKGKKGMVAGWGLTSENKSNYARHLQVLRLPYVPIEECQAEAPLDFRPSITGDKICAGYKKDKAVCKGDSGGGLAFPLSPKLAKDKVRYYLRGIVSTAPNNGTLCNIRWYATYTHLSRHERFIKEFVK